MTPVKFRFTYPSNFRRILFLEIDRQKQELPQCLLADGDEMVNLYR
jgi:hypothetical protein